VAWEHLVAEFIGRKLGTPVELMMYPNPDAYLQSFDKAEWDVALGPRVLAPPDKVDFTPDIWNINLVYVAAPGKEFPDIASVDKSDVNVGTIRGAPIGPRADTGDQERQDHPYPAESDHFR